jgi:site-specific recombinase XerD
MVLDDEYLPIKPIENFLAYCENIERSPNTIRSYAHHLKLFWEYLRDANLDWKSANTLDIIADFVAWLRCPTRYPHQLFADSGVTAERLQNYPGMW